MIGKSELHVLVSVISKWRDISDNQYIAANGFTKQESMTNWIDNLKIWIAECDQD
jgi:hypothetical protein